MKNKNQIQKKVLSTTIHTIAGYEGEGRMPMWQPAGTCSSARGTVGSPIPGN